ncbi:MAG: hypothetical protein PHN52_12900 [candidate division Zixibacteria bacterium]|nr:hypothetical protein [candidate division Zixibacteria bacterium]
MTVTKKPHDITFWGDEKLTSSKGRNYIIKRTSHNLLYLIEIPRENEIISHRDNKLTLDCLGELIRGENLLKADYIAIFLEVSNILVQLTNIQPFTRVCLVIGLRLLKPLWESLCNFPERPYQPEVLLSFLENLKKPPLVPETAP